jgi:hypothetical protein
MFMCFGNQFVLNLETVFSYNTLHQMLTCK